MKMMSTILLCVLSILCGSAIAQEPKPIFSSDAELLTRPGVQPYQNVTTWSFFAKVNGVYDMSQVSKAQIATGIATHGAGTNLAQLNIEHWAIGTPDMENHYFVANQLAIVAQAWAATDRPIGFYLGAGDYWGPVTHHQALRGELNRDMVAARAQLADRQVINDRKAAILNSLPIDFVVQSIYEPYPVGGNTIYWRTYAEFNLNEQLRCYPDKKRYAIIQPNLKTGTPLDLSQWQTMVAFCKAHDAIDGIIIFSRTPTYEGPTGWRDVVAGVQ